MIPTPDGGSRPPKMEERLETALEHWKHHRRAEGFATALNCIAFLSNGVAGLAKSNESLRLQLVQYQEAHKALVQVVAEQAEAIAKLTPPPPT